VFSSLYEANLRSATAELEDHVTRDGCLHRTTNSTPLAVPHEDFRPTFPLSDTRDKLPDTAGYDTDTALRFAENSQCFHMSEPVDRVDSEPVDTDHTPTLKRVFEATSVQPLSCCHAIQT